MLPIFSGRCLYQYMAAVTGSFPFIASGINLAWTSPYLPQILNGTYSGISMTSDEGSWCAVMPLLGGPLGALIISAIIDKFGRKSVILYMAPIATLAFILLAFSKTIPLIFLSRFIIGSVDGGLFVALPMYLGEISEPSIRGMLTASIGLYTILGTLFINIVGVHYSICISSLISAVIPVIHFLTFIFMPESPYYFMKKGNIEKAENSLKTLRGNNDIIQEIQEIRDSIYRQEKENNPKLTDLFTTKTNRRIIFIFLILCLTRKFSGKHPFMFYTVTIFQAVQGSLDPTQSVIIYICIEVLAASVALLILDHFGRRRIIIVCTIGCATGLCFCGLYFFLKDISAGYVINIGWLPLLALTVYNIFYTVGLELAPIVYLGELFPSNVKATALGLADTISVLISVIAAKLFQLLADNFGIYLPFWVFCCCCLLGEIFIIKYVPETKDKTLEEIQINFIKETSKANK